ncbi:ABC transporter ATP-binding protein [Croceicoccus hydrothermalis]|uniref:ABC transporter ATP-binding protein n=1 Tax=Croceicoccus hydrothermalis TaxID=2867964 RepID=UPI001EFC280E
MRPGKFVSGWLGVLRRMAAPEPKRLVLTLGLTLIVALTENITIGLLIPLITYAEPGAALLTLPLPGKVSDFAGNSELQIHIGVVLAILIALVIVRVLVQRSSDLRTSALITRFVRRTRFSLFTAISQTRWSVLASQRTADLHHNLTAEVDRLSALAYSSLSATKAAIIVAIYLAVACLISPFLTVVALSLAGLIFLMQVPLHKKVRASGQRSLDIRTGQTRTVSDFLSSLKVNKAFSLEPRYARTLDDLMIEQEETVRAYVSLQGRVNLIVQSAMIIGLSLFVYTSLVVAETTQAEVLIILLLFFRLSGRTQAIQTALREIESNAPCLERLDGMIAQYSMDEEEPVSAVVDAPRLHHEMRFDGVVLTYAGAKAPALDGVSLVIPARKLTALVGRTGSGKTTIADLALGLLSTDSGSLTIDGVTLGNDNRRAWREYVSLVPQDPVLFHGSIRENLHLVRPDATDAEMEEALETAHILATIRRLPHGLDTAVGDRGQMLSGGERQRLALARALLRKPALLVLDEATSALDSVTEAEVVRALADIRHETSILAITHRPALLDVADHVVLLRDGRIVEEGTKKLSLDALYASE